MYNQINENKKFMNDKDNKKRVEKLIKQTKRLEEDPDFDIELDDMKFTKLKKYESYDLVKVSTKELKLILPNHDLKEGTYLYYLGIQKLDNDNYSIQLDIFTDRFIRINLNEVNCAENINLIFHLYDTDGNDKISFAEFNRLMIHYSKFNLLEFTDDQVKIISTQIFKRIDEKNKVYIEKTDLSKYLSQYIGLKDIELSLNPFKKLKTNDAVKKLNYTKEDFIYDQKLEKRVARKKNRSKINKFVLLNFKGIIWTLIYVGLCIGLGILNTVFETNRRWFLTLAARFFGGVIYFNLGLVLLFRSLTFITLLNKTCLSSILPLKDTKFYHEVCGCMLLASVLIHIVLHIGGDFPQIAAITSRIPKDAYVTVAWLTFANQTGIWGIISTLIFAPVMVLPLIPYIKNKKFEVFFYSHKLFYFGLGALYVHGYVNASGARKGFIYFMSFPIALHIIELLIRFIRFFLFKTHIKVLKMLPSEVMFLEVDKPTCFGFSSGQYCYLQIPEISSFQWHPFTIASSPEEETIYFFIAPTGDWTNLLNILSDKLNNVSKGIIESEKDLKETKLKIASQEMLINKKISIRMDGPFGAPAENFKNYEHLIFIASGVGATPFSSILVTLLYMMKNKEKPLSFKSLTFYWLQRNYSKVDYLNDILGQVIAEDKNNIIEVNVFITGAQTKFDLR